MKRKNNMAALLMVTLLTVLGGSMALSQNRPLKHGKMALNGTTYSVTVSDKHSRIYIYDYLLYDKIKPLINPELGVGNIPEDFIQVNADKLLEIKRKFYAQNIRADISLTITKDGRFMGLDYVLPKSPTITEQQFRTLDTEVRKHLKVSVVFPNEWVKNQKYNGYATKYVILR